MSDDKKRVLLLSFCEECIYKILCGVVLLRTIEEVPYMEIVQLLSERFETKPPRLVGRSRFYRRDQQQEELIDEYVAALKTLAKECNFGGVVTDTETLPQRVHPATTSTDAGTTPTVTTAVASHITRSSTLTTSASPSYST